MEHIREIPKDAWRAYLAVLLIWGVTTGAVGYAAGHANMPAGAFEATTGAAPVYEDWHGNVRRSYGGL